MGIETIRARVQLLWLGARLKAARRREARALVALGRALEPRPLGSDDPAARELLAHLGIDRARLDKLEHGLADSLEADRADYRAVGGWVQPVVIVRGMLDRGVLRARMHGIRRELLPVHRALGQFGAEGRLGGGSSAAQATAPEQMARVREAQAVCGELELRRAGPLALVGGEPLPHWMVRVGRELAGVGAAIAGELRGKLVPRLPALAALGAGWWVTQSFTDSYWEGALRHFGLHEGRSHVISSKQYEALSFWLPLVAGAVCSYLCSRVAAWARARYGTPEPEPVLPPHAETIRVAAVDVSAMGAQRRPD